jgi:broad specificity phosphatase PhoE
LARNIVVTASLTVVRHGATEWSTLGRHTSRTDVPLLPEGEKEAIALERRLHSRSFTLVLTSPRRRAIDTARLAGFPDAVIDPNLSEWDYGADEGRTTAEIRVDRPNWDAWRDGFLDGEPLDHVAGRADAVIERAFATGGDILIFAHAHFLRVLAARWVGLPPVFGRHVALDPATISVLGWYRDDQVITLWNSRAD